MARRTTTGRGARTSARPGAPQPGMAPFTLVNGGDEFLNARTLRRQRNKARKLLPDAEVVELDAAQTDQYTFTEAVSPSLLSPVSIVLLTHFEYCSDELLAAIKDFAKNAPARLVPEQKPGTDPASAADPATAVSLVIASRSQGPRGATLATKLKGGHTEILTIPALKRDRDRQDFARAQLARRGRRIAPDALNALVAVMGSRTGELAAMCDQLCDDFEENPLRLETVASVMDDTAETTGFQVADTALAGNAPLAVLRLRQALARGAQPVALVGALSSKLHSLAVTAAVQAGTIDESRAGLPGWLVRSLRGQLRGWSSQGLARAFEALAHADETAKGVGGDPEYELERAVELICRKGA